MPPMNTHRPGIPETTPSNVPRPPLWRPPPATVRDCISDSEDDTSDEGEIRGPRQRSRGAQNIVSGTMSSEDRKRNDGASSPRPAGPQRIHSPDAFSRNSNLSYNYVRPFSESPSRIRDGYREPPSRPQNFSANYEVARIGPRFLGPEFGEKRRTPSVPRQTPPGFASSHPPPPPPPPPQYPPPPGYFPPPALPHQTSQGDRRYRSTDPQERSYFCCPRHGHQFVEDDSWDYRESSEKPPRPHSAQRHLVPPPAHVDARRTHSRHRRRRRPSRSLDTIDEDEELVNSGDSESSLDSGLYDIDSPSISSSTRLYGDYHTIRRMGKVLATQIERQIITAKKEEELRQKEIELMRLEVEGKVRRQMELERIKAETAEKQAEEERKRIELEIRQRIQLEARAEEEARKAEAERKEEAAKISHETIQKAVDQIAERARERILQDLKIASTQTTAAEEAQTKRHKYHLREEAYGTKRRQDATTPPRSLSDSSIGNSNLTVRSAQSAPTAPPIRRPHQSPPPPAAPEPPSQAPAPTFASSISDEDNMPQINPSESSHMTDDGTSSSSAAQDIYEKHAAPSITGVSGISNSTYRSARRRARERFNKEERQRQRLRVIREELVEPIAKSLIKLVRETRTQRGGRRVHSRASDDFTSDEEMWGDDESATTPRRYQARAKLRRSRSRSWSSQTQRPRPEQSGLTKWEHQRHHDDLPGLFRSAAPGWSGPLSQGSDVMSGVSDHRLLPVNTQPLLPLEPLGSRFSLPSLVGLPLSPISEESDRDVSRASNSTDEDKGEEATIQACQETGEEDVEEIIVSKRPKSVITQVWEKPVERISKIEISKGTANTAGKVIIQVVEKTGADDDTSEHAFEEGTATKVENMIIQVVEDTGEDDDDFEDALEEQTEHILPLEGELKRKAPELCARE